jgi:hypothetical protein
MPASEANQAPAGQVSSPVPASGLNQAPAGQASSPLNQAAPDASLGRVTAEQQLSQAQDASLGRVAADQQFFLAGRVHEPPGVPAVTPAVSARVTAGTQVAGRVKSPIVFISGDEKAGGRNFAIELQEPIPAGAGTIPSKTLLLGRVETVAANGVMLLEGTLLVLPDGSEYELPEGAVEVRGSGGNPLIASRVAPERAANLLKTAGAMIAGAAQEAARLSNQPRRQETIIGDRQTIVSSSQPRPDYSAAALTGAMNALSPRLQQALQPTSPQFDSLVWLVGAGRSVAVFFNRTVALELPQ